MTNSRVAIVGAGPAGCMLALILLQAGIHCSIFEAEASVSGRDQGGTLDLHPQTGQAALERAGLLDKFHALARYEGEAFKLTDKHLHMFLNLDGTSRDKSRGRPEIGRSQLRQMLIDALPSDIIKWNHRLTSATSSPLSLHFAATCSHDAHSISIGTGSEFDLLVGADGAFSQIRPLVSSAVPFHTGLVLTRYHIHNANEMHPDLATLVNQGSLFAFAPGAAIMSQYQDSGTLSVSSYRSWVTQSMSSHDGHDGYVSS